MQRRGASKLLQQCLQQGLARQPQAEGRQAWAALGSVPQEQQASSSGRGHPVEQASAPRAPPPCPQSPPGSS
jgi:hypothetical protein